MGTWQVSCQVALTFKLLLFIKITSLRFDEGKLTGARVHTRWSFQMNFLPYLAFITNQTMQARCCEYGEKSNLRRSESLFIFSQIINYYIQFNATFEQCRLLSDAVKVIIEIRYCMNFIGNLTAITITLCRNGEAIDQPTFFFFIGTNSQHTSTKC